MKPIRLVMLIGRCWMALCLLLMNVAWAEPPEVERSATAGISMPLVLADGWVRETPPGVPNGVAFMTLRNTAEADVVLDAVACTAASACELHQHVHVAGKMRMQKVASLRVPAGGELKLSTGGYHVMLLGLKTAVKVGDVVTLTLMSGDTVVGKCVLPVKAVRSE